MDRANDHGRQHEDSGYVGEMKEPKTERKQPYKLDASLTGGNREHDKNAA